MSDSQLNPGSVSTDLTGESQNDSEVKTVEKLPIKERLESLGDMPAVREKKPGKILTDEQHSAQHIEGYEDYILLRVFVGRLYLLVRDFLEREEIPDAVWKRLSQAETGVALLTGNYASQKRILEEHLRMLESLGNRLSDLDYRMSTIVDKMEGR